MLALCGADGDAFATKLSALRRLRDDPNARRCPNPSCGHVTTGRADAPDMDEQFDAMFEARILGQDPESLAYKNAAKHYSPKSPGKKATPSSDPTSGPRARFRPFQ